MVKEGIRRSVQMIRHSLKNNDITMQCINMAEPVVLADETVMNVYNIHQKSNLEISSTSLLSRHDNR